MSDEAGRPKALRPRPAAPGGAPRGALLSPAVGDNTLATGKLTATSTELGAVTKASGLMAEAGQPLAEHRPDDEGRIRAALLSSRGNCAWNRRVPARCRSAQSDTL